MKMRILSMLLCLAMCFGTIALLAGCTGPADPNNGDNGSGKTPEALVLMSDELDGLFNPFFSTTAPDGSIVGMTQISMLTAKYENGSIVEGFGDDEAVVAKDYMSKYDPAKNETVYTFVLKNGIKFADGEPLTMEDVMFNLYVYLDPVYTGSSTMYSTDIKGLAAYRTQIIGADSNSDSDTLINNQASAKAQDRINELINLFRTQKKSDGSYYATADKMRELIAGTVLSSGYKAAISNNPADVTNANLLADYEHALELFRKELESDYVSAQNAYTEEPYKSYKDAEGNLVFADPIMCYMCFEGYVSIEWAKDENNKIDRTKIEKIDKYYGKAIDTKEKAIEYVFADKISSQLDIVLSYWATANELTTEYSAKAKEVILSAGSTGGKLKVDHIDGIVSLGHNADTKGTTITVNGNEYKIASAHNSDGTVANEGEYDVLQITINGVDPKAVWNFSFSVAPQHYYGEGAKTPVNIENNQFGVDFGTFEFMTKTVQSVRNNSLPMGAGAYKATDRSNSDTPDRSEFFKNGIVYFKANNYFETVGSGLNNSKIDKVRYQVVSTANALAMLESGAIHYATPQLTNDNYDKIESLKQKGFASAMTDQLGYGYIGVNAAKVTDLNLRKAIMCAMNTTLALDYYRAGTASQIYWPMSVVSWAYPKDAAGVPVMDNGRDYPQINGRFDRNTAIKSIKNYMEAAGVTAGSDKLKFTFTIAGANVQDHPTYKTFRDAAALLNELGWNIEVVADAQALTKISTGSLTVWAAAWGSSIDPDMYQVYHKNSTATSTLAWGYPSIKKSGSAEEKAILNELSDLIDQARETLDQAERTELYEKAMGKVLDLAIELPVYQRSTIYAYNAKVIDSSTLPEEINPYSSPLDRLWEIEFAK